MHQREEVFLNLKVINQPQKHSFASENNSPKEIVKQKFNKVIEESFSWNKDEQTKKETD